ncbi:MAG: hypothetical protein ABIJ34_03200 [archaeon]
MGDSLNITTAPDFIGDQLETIINFMSADLQQRNQVNLPTGKKFFTLRINGTDNHALTVYEAAEGQRRFSDSPQAFSFSYNQNKLGSIVLVPGTVDIDGFKAASLYETAVIETMQTAPELEFMLPSYTGPEQARRISEHMLGSLQKQYEIMATSISEPNSEKRCAAYTENGCNVNELGFMIRADLHEYRKIRVGSYKIKVDPMIAKTAFSEAKADVLGVRIV